SGDGIGVCEDLGGGPSMLGLLARCVDLQADRRRVGYLARQRVEQLQELERRFGPARAVRGRRDPASNRHHILANSIAGFAQVCTLDQAPSGKTTPRGVVTTAVAPTHGVTKPPRLTILHDVRARKSMRFPAPITHSRLSGLANRNESGGRLI